MFKAKHSNLVVTQYEHLKLSGALAFLWGNDQFEAPPCRFESFVNGVALHDRGYGFFDTISIGEASDEEWSEVSRRGFFDEYDDKVADLIVKHHVLRLVSWHKPLEGEILTMKEEMERTIAADIARHNLDPQLFTFADRITNLCDNISFDFCFQNYGEGSVYIQPRFTSEDTTQIKYTLEEDGTIKLSPWPLSVSSCQGYLIGYETNGFPDELEPHLMPYRIEPLE